MFSKTLTLLLNLSLLIASQQKRIVAVGDIHGDIEHVKVVMHMAGVTDKESNWIGGSDLTLVQTGDILDRGKDTIELFTWLGSLQKQAEAAGGKFVMLLGNHEVMNLKGNWRYVSEDEKKTFRSIEERQKVFSKDGWIGKFIRKLPISTVINGTVFVHGGIKRTAIPNGISKMNDKGSKYLNEDTETELKLRESFRQASNGPIWYRGYYNNPEPEACKELKEVLDLIGAQRMVMGHSITKSHSIESRCNGMAYFVDVGISSFYGSNHFAALQLTETTATAIYPNKNVSLPFIPSNPRREIESSETEAPEAEVSESNFFRFDGFYLLGLDPTL